MPTTATANPADTARFFDALFEHESLTDQHISIWTLNDHRAKCFTQGNGAADYAVKQGAKTDTYVRVTTLAKPIEGTKERGKAEVSAAAVGLFTDIDIQGPTHPNRNLPPDRETALAIIAKFPLKPSFVIDSGYGFQCFWLFPEPIIFESDKERDQFSRFVKRFGATIESLANEMGYKVGASETSNLDRVLRIPGTFNHATKVNPRPDPVAVTIVEDTEFRYEPDDFEQYLVDDPGPGHKKPNTRANISIDPNANPPADKLDSLLERNAYFRKLWEHQPESKRDPSLLGYGWRIAHVLLKAKWAHQEVADALIAFYREHADNPEHFRKNIGQREIGRIIGRQAESLESDTTNAKNGKGCDPDAIHLTDTGNAKRLVKVYGSNIRFCYQIGKFLIFDGKRWVIDNTGAVERAAKLTARDILRFAETIDDDKVRAAVVKWALRSEGGQRIREMINLVKSEKDIVVQTKQLDADHWLFNVLPGTIDLKTGKLRPHTRADLITKLAPVDYDPNAKAPRWRQFLSEIFDCNEELICYVQQLLV